MFSNDRPRIEQEKRSPRVALHALFLRGVSISLMTLVVIHPLTACGRNSNGDHQPASRQSGVTQGNPPTSSSPAPTVTSDLSVPVYKYEVISSWPHDPKAFTQGLVFHQGTLYESTGRYGSSTLRRIELATGRVAKKINLKPQYFGEGITVYQGKIYQLTWSEQRCFVYDLSSMRFETELAYEGEGWGLTTDGHQLIMSDGTNQLRFIDPVTFRVVRTISVKDNNAPLLDINELEYVRGEIYANVWKSDRIARIDPNDGRLLGWIDLTGLVPANERNNPSEDVLNGIAYDEIGDRLFVTGKRWPKVFEIRVTKK